MFKKIIFLIFIGMISAQNNYPIVLVHGFMGWGTEEMGGYKYWGGSEDYAQFLRDEGHTVFTVSIGPVSSNWERAIEVYSQLKGGQVDYGKAHSNQFSLIQKPEGKIYTALYPEWDENHPVHLIGHSMGGQTARMLQYLLTHEIMEDDNNGIAEESSLLSGLHQNWIRSITSISTPHDGTTLADIVTRTMPFVQYFVGLAGVVGTRFYEFDLEQWGFSREEEESWTGYVKRMRTHNAWDSKNMSSWELSIEGAKELNAFLQVDPDVYYFSISTTTTIKKDESQYHIPINGTSLLTRTRSKIIGSRVGYWNDGSATDSTWYENDGIVNTRSMRGPTTGANGPDPIVKYDENELLIPGQWYTLGPFQIDHWNIVGHLGTEEANAFAKQILFNQAVRLKALPSF
ncbi:MAG: lipase [Candidatus Marinimicrobia bacterium]|jgi:triacylglycerol lipase|nr:lipase [Candidatus Neomarinimicrobiota bacterium]MBT3838419.1 lipase [Candidatus Neomarinimicrobiota bacterium]MBT3998724.1 lipase [Candidatus Neomarinimicrobiota bacterium]MBT4283303.1 lipase [Candidatus Neomarinimicrobiota bacterium]MBT4578384.1 lipase [Candidatus Neomarinimicrobiota bacterium]